MHTGSHIVDSSQPDTHALCSALVADTFHPFPFSWPQVGGLTLAPAEDAVLLQVRLSWGRGRLLLVLLVRYLQLVPHELLSTPH